MAGISEVSSQQSEGKASSPRGRGRPGYNHEKRRGLRGSRRSHGPTCREVKLMAPPWKVNLTVECSQGGSDGLPRVIGGRGRRGPEPWGRGGVEKMLMESQHDVNPCGMQAEARPSWVPGPDSCETLAGTTSLS